MTEATGIARKSLWTRARDMAAQAPPERNRQVDFLRALSILAVVVGHWLVAAPYMKDGAVEGGHLLGILPWTQWLTWGFRSCRSSSSLAAFLTTCRRRCAGCKARPWTLKQRGHSRSQHDEN